METPEQKIKDIDLMISSAQKVYGRYLTGKKLSKDDIKGLLQQIEAISDLAKKSELERIPREWLLNPKSKKIGKYGAQNPTISIGEFQKKMKNYTTLVDTPRPDIEAIKAQYWPPERIDHAERASLFKDIFGVEIPKEEKEEKDEKESKDETHKGSDTPLPELDKGDDLSIGATPIPVKDLIDELDAVASPSAPRSDVVKKELDDFKKRYASLMRSKATSSMKKTPSRTRRIKTLSSARKSKMEEKDPDLVDPRDKPKSKLSINELQNKTIINLLAEIEADLDEKKKEIAKEKATFRDSFGEIPTQEVDVKAPVIKKFRVQTQKYRDFIDDKLTQFFGDNGGSTNPFLNTGSVKGVKGFTKADIGVPVMASAAQINPVMVKNPFLDF